MMGILSGCTFPYVPGENDFPESKIKPLPATKPVALINVKKSESINVYADAFFGDLKEITQAYIAQVTKQLERRGGRVDKNATKTIRAKVINMHAVIEGFQYHCAIDYMLILGNGENLTLREEHRSPGALPFTLNGCIAKSVMQTLNNQTVRDYLVQ
jgi:hypothetical protein